MDNSFPFLDSISYIKMDKILPNIFTNSNPKIALVQFPILSIVSLYFLNISQYYSCIDFYHKFHSLSICISDQKIPISQFSISSMLTQQSTTLALNDVNRQNQVSQQFQHCMAFVFRGERKTDLAKVLHNAAPGSYELDIQKEVKIPKAFVPFGTMETRAKDNTFKMSSLPGPGSYNIGENQNGEKIVVSSQTEDIKILQISRPHPVFKSGTQRFQLPKQQDINPGPGEYNVTKSLAQRPKMLSTNTTSSKPKIIEHLININKYQSIPSIPSNLHAYGYNENQNNELELNQPPIEVYKGEKEDKVGPGHYNVQAKERTKATSCWSQAKEKRWDETAKTNANVGPGTYDVKSVQSLYSYKPTAGFASKTLRSMDQRKGAILNEQNIRRGEKIVEDGTSSQASNMDSRVFSEKNPPSTMIDDESDDEYEYIDDTTPGPGSYLEISEVKKFNKPSRPAVPSFGVGTKRFNHTAAPKISQVGPGSYNPNLDIQKIKHKQKQVIPPKDAYRFPELVNIKKLQQPGPGSYEPRNTMQDKLIYKIQRGYRGQFGTTQIRSKQMQDNDQPGPGEYNPQAISQQKQSLSVFKSSTKRNDLANLNNIPAPGVYNTNNYDISTRVIKEEEDDPDLIIKKPGFGVGEKRFREAPIREEDFDDDDIIKQIQDKYREEKKKKMLKNSANFKQGVPRLKDARSQVPGPGAYYDGEEDQWNKRTYNILFADI